MILFLFLQSTKITQAVVKFHKNYAIATPTMKYLKAAFIFIVATSACEMKKLRYSYVANDAPLTQAASGSWAGVLPCADCAGIKYYLLLSENGEFREETVYQDESENLFITEGQWNIREDSVITLEHDGIHRKLRYYPKNLKVLDQSGSEIRSSFPDKYFLKRTDDNHQGENGLGMLNGAWSLYEQNGFPVTFSGLKKEHPWLEFNSQEGTVGGYGGCNHLSGNFEIVDDSLIFGPVISTKMACEAMEVETRLLEALSRSSFSFGIADSTLHLTNKAHRLLFKKKNPE